MTNKPEMKKALRFFCGTLAIILICSILIWGFQSSWGQVRIERFYITGDDGSVISGLSYIPKTATAENPAQAVLICHGRSNHAHSNDTWSLELARRGYVVYSPDLSGGGHSDVNDRVAQSSALARYMTTLDFIDTSNMTVIGYSAGNRNVQQILTDMPQNFPNAILVMSPTLINIPEGYPEGCSNLHICIIKGQADQYNFEFVGDLEACRQKVTDSFGLDELVEYDKDYDLGNGNTLRYDMVTDFCLHQTANVSPDAIRYLIGYMSYNDPSPVNTVSDNNYVWGWQQLFSGIAGVAMMFLLAAMINLLMQFPYFAPAANKLPERPVNRKNAKDWIIDILFSVAIPAVIFIHVSAYVMAWTGETTFLGKFLKSTNLNGIMGWLLVLAIIGLIRLAIRNSKMKKAGISITMADYCLGTEDETSIVWSRVGKGLLIGVICSTFTFVWLHAIEGFLGINYQIWNLCTYVDINPARLVRAIPYIIIIFTVMFIGNLTQRVLPSTGSERKDMWIAVTVNTVLTAAALAILLFIQYGGNMAIGTGEAVFKQITIPGVKGTSVGALDFAFGYCYMMGGTTGVVTYIYRKYGNIWLGVIPAAIFAGLVTTSGFTMVG